MSFTVTRGLLLRWIGWFGLANGALAALIGLRYLLAFGLPDGLLATAYVSLAFIGQFAVLGFIPLMLVLAPVVFLAPRKWLVVMPAVVLAAVALTVLVLDTNVFAQYRYHLNGMTVAIFEPSTWVLAGLIGLVLLVFQFVLADLTWKQVTARRSRHGGLLAGVLVLVWLGSQGIHIWADATAYSPVTSFTRYLPAYFPMKAKRRLAKLGWVDPEAVEKQRLLRQADAPDAGQLNYPLQPLQCVVPEKPLNIVMVLIDALRPDLVNRDNTPVIAELASEGQHFRNHYSGGNSSRMGIFSIFYGLPGTYWQAFYDTQRPPVLMNELLDAGYDIAAFSAVGFGSPAQINRTVFGAISPDRLRVPDPDDGLPKNASVDRQWREWIRGRDSAQPFFGFIYLDPGYAEAGDTDPTADELEQRFQGYLNGIRETDTFVGAVLADLDAAGLRDDTLVIVASDHGYEFDELGLGYVGHASNYGPYQLRATLVMDWPGRAAQRFDHRSAHQDLPATLLQDVMNCTSPARDYSSGVNLFNGESWAWLAAGSYNSTAIVLPDAIIVTNPGGLVELLGPDYRPDSGLELDRSLMEEAVVEMRRFYR